MAAVVLISTTGFTINMHFCHDQLINMALNTPAESCCDVSNPVPCDHTEALSQMDHCSDDSIVVEALEGFVGSSLDINLDCNQSTDILFWIALQFNSPGMGADIKPVILEYYLPPPCQEVDLSQIQSYLI